MTDAYANALGTVASAYERSVQQLGGKSLSRVATIVASSGAFFNRLRAGRTFSVENLERFNDWFRRPGNWPERTVPDDASAALASMGRPVVHDVHMPHTCGTPRHADHFNSAGAEKGAALSSPEASSVSPCDGAPTGGAIVQPDRAALSSGGRA